MYKGEGGGTKPGLPSSIASRYGRPTTRVERGSQSVLKIIAANKSFAQDCHSQMADDGLAGTR